MSTLLIAFAMVMGVGLSVQPLLNARVAAAAAHPLYGAMLSVLISTLTLGVMAVLLRIRWPDVRGLAALPTWSFSGGLIGAFIVLAALVAAPRLGATTTTALFITGQLTGSLLLDQFGWLGVPEHPLDLKRALGVLCLVAGVTLIRLA